MKVTMNASIRGLSARTNTQAKAIHTVGDTSVVTRTCRIYKYPNRAAFPSLGEKDGFYLDCEEETIYLWQDDTLTYLAVGSNWHNIKVIQGGNA